MSKLFLIPALFILVLQTQAQKKLIDLKGKVVNETTGEVLPGATIYLHDLKRGTIADLNGFFLLNEIPAGTHLIEISFAGFSNRIESVLLNESLDKNFSLKPAITEHNEVVVTGVAAATSLKRVSTPAVIIKKQDLLSGASSNIIEAITKKPGINLLGTGPAVSKPVIRGLGYNRVVVINDGLRQEGQQWGDEHGIEIDEYSIQKAEVLKGPASIMYGSDAIAGVINFVTQTSVAEGTISGSFLSNYQSNNQLRGFFGNIGGNKKGFSFNAYASTKAAGDYQNKFDGYVFNSKFREFNAGVAAGVNKKWGYSQWIFSSFNQRLGLVEGERDANGNFVKFGGTSLEAPATDDDFAATKPFIPYQHIIHQKLVTDNSFYLGKGKLNLNIGVQQNQRMEYGEAEEPDTKELFFDLKTLNYNLQYHSPSVNNGRFSVGVAGMNQNNTNKGEEAIIPDYNINDIGAFIFAQKKIEKLNLSGGLRFDHRSLQGEELMEGADVKFQSFSRSFSNITGSAGLTYELTGNFLFRLNLARGFRAPNMAELASNGAHEGTNRYEIGNTNLKSEVSLQADAGLEWNTEHISLNAALFHNNINNYIFIEKVASINGGDSLISVDGEQLYVFRFVQQNARLYGMELSFDIHPHPLDWLHIENSFSYVRGLLQTPIEGNKNIPFIPAARFLSELRVDLFKHKNYSFRNTYVKLELDHNFQQQKAFTAFNTETETPSYTLLNAGLGTDVFTKNEKRFSLFFVVQNITDVSYQNHLSRLKYTGSNPVTGRMGVFNMGRNFSIKLHIPFHANWKSK